MTKLDKDQVIAAFTQAYTTTNGKQPQIEAKGGWYSVDGGKNVRLAQLAEMTEQLTTSETSSQTQTKPAAKAKPVAKQTKVSKSGFSVKAFWNQQLEQSTPGYIKPR